MLQENGSCRLLPMYKRGSRLHPPFTREKVKYI